MPPISPYDITNDIPEKVFDAFNKLIAQKFNGIVSVIYQEEIVKALVDLGMDRIEIFDKGFLNIEDHYRRAGWVVKYEKNMTYSYGDSFFSFYKKESCKI